MRFGPVPTTVGEEHVHEVRRAWPSGDRIVLELVDPHGRVTAGRIGPDGHVEIGRVGHDDALPGLAPLLYEGARVIGHRLGKRAVVDAGERIVKLVRPSKVDGAVERHRSVQSLIAACGDPVRVPKIVAVDETLGSVAFEKLDGAPILDGPRSEVAAGSLGEALRQLARAVIHDGLPVHSAEDEAGVLRRWASDAERFGVLPDSVLARYLQTVEEAVSSLRGLGDRPLSFAHRDLHDGQVLTGGGHDLVLLDLDTAAVADPALDVGNFLAHLDLARAEGRLRAEQLRVLTRARHTRRRRHAYRPV